MELDEWLKSVNILALKAFADGMPGVHEAKKPQVMEFILNDAEARDMAMRSKAIEEAARGVSS